MNDQTIRVTVWGEYIHDRDDAPVREIYPDGMHDTIAGAIREHLGDRVTVRTATLDQPDHGLTQDVLVETDVLTWWGHTAHAAVTDEVVDRVCNRVLGGMGLIVLHSGHESKVFQKLMGTSCSLRWRESGDREVVWTVAPGHPITEGIPDPFVIPEHETYAEYFDIPQPDELVFISSFSGGEVFRGGCCFRRGRGRIFYFSPGHETQPIYYQAEVRRVIANAVKWARRQPGGDGERPRSTHVETGWFTQGVSAGE